MSPRKNETLNAYGEAFRLNTEPLSQTNFETPVARPIEIISGAALVVIGAGAVFVGAAWAVFDNPRRQWEMVEFGALIAGLGIAALVLGIRLLLHRRRPRDGGLMSPTALRLGGLGLLIGSALPLARGAIGLVHVAATLGAVAACFVLARRREFLATDRREPNARPRDRTDS